MYLTYSVKSGHVMAETITCFDKCKIFFIKFLLKQGKGSFFPKLFSFHFNEILTFALLILEKLCLQ